MGTKYFTVSFSTLNLIEAGAIRKLGCGFLFPFHSNYGDILYRLRDIATYWQKIASFFHILLHSTPPLWRSASECCHNVHHTRQRNDLHILYIKKSFGMRSVQHTGSVLWNTLLSMLKECMSKKTFKKKLKNTYFLKWQLGNHVKFKCIYIYTNCS